MTVDTSRRWWTLAALSLSVLVVALDLFVLTLALPTLSADLHASSSDLQWFVDAYSLVLAAALLPAGLFGDRIGRKRLLLAALVLFGIASVGCAYSTSAAELIAARAVLGLAAAVILPMSLAVLPVMFDAAERPRAIAAVGGATFLGYPIGPLLGGWLLDHYWWGSVFLINVPVVVVAIIAVATLMPESRGERAPRIDGAGIALSSGGLMLVTYGLIKAGENGWADPAAVATMLAGAGVLAGFVAWERRGSHALVDLGLFSSRGFLWGTILATLVSFALFGLVFAMPLYYRDVRGYDALAAGVRMLPMLGGLVVGLVLGQRLASPGRHAVSTRVLVAAGFLIMGAALAAGTRTTAATGSAFTAAWFAVTGLGLGIAMPVAMNAALGALSAARSGSGSALLTAMRQVGGTIGVAVLGTVLTTVYQRGLPAGVTAVARSSVSAGIAVAQRASSAALLGDVRGAFVHGLDIMLWVCAAVAFASAVLGLAFLSGRAGPADEAAEAPARAGMSV
jgi:MFS transporter, DHA2 family, multidrug resistance protein